MNYEKGIFMCNIKYQIKDQAIAAVTSDGMELKFVSDDLKNDRDVVVAAIKQNGLALEFASVELRAEPDIVVMAAKQNGWAAFMSLDDNLHFDKKVMLAALKEDEANWGAIKAQIGIEDPNDSKGSI